MNLRMLRRGMLGVAAGLLCAVLHAGGLVICASCGHESTSGGGKTCAHCDAQLPQDVTQGGTDRLTVRDGPTNVTSIVVDPQAAGLAREAFEAARIDVGCARAEEARRPELALAYYENALAVLAAADAAALPADTGRHVVEGLQRCRDALAVASKACSACGGSGRRRIQVAMLAGSEDRDATLEGQACELCGGSGRVRAARHVEGARLALLQGRREHELRQLAAGRAALGRAWVPAGWPDKLKARQVAAVRRAVAPPCAECAGLGLADCRTCGGAGEVPCRAAGCREGWVQSAPANSLSPESSIKLRSKCTTCHGTARAPCTACRGDGKLPCSACKGSGASTRCNSCGGQGSVSCRRCQGSGRDADGNACEACRGEGCQVCGSCRGDGCRSR